MKEVLNGISIMTLQEEETCHIQYGWIVRWVAAT